LSQFPFRTAEEGIRWKIIRTLKNARAAAHRATPAIGRNKVAFYAIIGAGLIVAQPAMANEWYIHSVDDAGRVFCKLETNGGPVGLALYERSHGDTTQMGFVNQGMYKAGIDVRMHSAYFGTCLFRDSPALACLGLSGLGDRAR
jgi:hypothetical protein